METALRLVPAFLFQPILTRGLSPFCEHAIPIGHEIRFVEEHAFAFGKNFLQHQATRQLKVHKIDRAPCQLRQFSINATFSLASSG